MGKAAFCVVGLMTIVFIASFLWHDQLFSGFALVSQDVWARPWTLVTHMFLHADLMHFAYNAFALALFGLVLERRIGHQNFLLIFFSTGLLAGFVSTLFYHSVVGASGAVMGLIGTLAVLRPRMVVWSLGVPMPIVAAACVWILLDLAGFSTADNVAHAAHLAGLGFGIVLGLFMKEEYGDRKGKERREELISDEEHDRWEREHMGV
jgi:membrane associated rhomboid family serine protease